VVRRQFQVNSLNCQWQELIKPSQTQSPECAQNHDSIPQFRGVTTNCTVIKSSIFVWWSKEHCIHIVKKKASGWFSKGSILDPNNLWTDRVTLAEEEDIHHLTRHDRQVLPHMSKPRGEEWVMDSTWGEDFSESTGTFCFLGGFRYSGYQTHAGDALLKLTLDWLQLNLVLAAVALWVYVNGKTEWAWEAEKRSHTHTHIHTHTHTHTHRGGREKGKERRSKEGEKQHGGHTVEIRSNFSCQEPQASYFLMPIRHVSGKLHHYHTLLPPCLIGQGSFSLWTLTQVCKVEGNPQCGLLPLKWYTYCGLKESVITYVWHGDVSDTGREGRPQSAVNICEV